jgi:signal transduction histidine kinase
MNNWLFGNALIGALQLAVPSYGLRLNRLFGSRQVGWALVGAFLGLALLNLATGMGAVPARLDGGQARNVVGAVIPVLLLIGMAHVEALLRQRSGVEREQRLRACELERFLDFRTEELTEAREEFCRELSRRDQEQRAFMEKAQQERLELGAQVAAWAGRHLNRHLAVIELYAKVLRSKQSEPGTTQYHNRLRAGTAEARALGRRLLAAGCCQPLRTQLVSLGDVVRRHQAALRRLLREPSSLEWTFGVDAPLVWADPQHVGWMLEELVRNAGDAMTDNGRVSITVERVKLDQPHPGKESGTGEFACVVVTDTGRGMDRTVQRHLGEPFFTTNPSQRAGLGLASVSGLIKAHGGWLTVSSALSHGTKVRLFFPSGGPSCSAA